MGMEGQHNGLWSVYMKNQINKISVIGLGYIGLPTAAMLASRGVKVIGVDVNANVVETINTGKVHIVEPDLDIIVQSVVSTGYLRAVTTPEAADVFIITVPTPFKIGHEPDLSFVEAAVVSIAPVLEKGNLIILESTSPVGTTEAIAKQLSMLRADLIFPQSHSCEADVNIAYCPERVMPGQIIRELIENDRIIGGITATCTQRAYELYKMFVRSECIITDSRTAEMAKLTENAFRDVNIAFANELSIICDKLHIDVWELIKLANRHPRVNILQPGPGVGGHCIAVDPWFIVNATPDEARLIRTARKVNDSKPQYVLEKIHQAALAFANPKICCLGIAYKANTDDLRESPAVKIIEQLTVDQKYHITIVEPNIKELPKELNHCQLAAETDFENVLKTSDIIILMVAHKEFKMLDERLIANKIIINIANPQDDFNKLLLNQHQSSQTSEYGRMMMNRIYGNIP